MNKEAIKQTNFLTILKSKEIPKNLIKFDLGFYRVKKKNNFKFLLFLLIIQFRDFIAGILH